MSQAQAPGDDGGSTSLGDLGIGWLSDSGDLLQSFASQPRAFIIGAVLTTVIDGLFDIAISAVDLVLLILGGSRPLSSPATEEFLGVADVPFLIARTLISTGRRVVLTAGGIVTDLASDLAALPEPLPALLAPAIVVALLVIARVAGERLLRIALDLIPGAGGLL
ncbi:hypothetical protein DVK02_12880 [Halobellus sp. Atlit-31R]|nr:hypothetical protein DVK02_12880 [Halobellus sp. Atlit-31R]